ncbi:FadR/GntR family transcriptional regulator [Phytoactinopolyspora mesophila]|uniref:FadR/GntR family transcriptional regulator n=1 Tax=Phytoactinopolyspora mesophila TaxID=2650750 RepID=UPI00157750AC|nr:FadR/GntR family transcriptional regulator [Phytoactinopolyspora mesophila]
MADEVTFERVRPVRAYERVVEQIEEHVLRGQLKPGDRLPSERTLMEQFGVSRSTIREALRVLESNGLVRSRHGDPGGPEILPFSPTTLHKSVTRLVRTDQVGLGELVQFRMLLDGSANLLAAKLATDAEIAEMDIALARMESTIGDGYVQFSQADLEFHDAVARASRSTLIQVCSDVVRGVVLSLITQKIADSPDQQALMRKSLSHHAEVLEAVRDRDGERAARLARQALYAYYAEYVSDAEQPLLEALLEDDAPPPPSFAT